MGVKLTLRGYLTKQWCNAVRSSQEDPTPTPEACRQGSKLVAINQIWSPLVLLRPWGERNKILHKEKNHAIVHLEYNSRIISAYAQQRDALLVGITTYVQKHSHKY